MYDIAYFMPVSFNGKYKERLRWFRHYGMLNRGGVAMKLYMIYSAAHEQIDPEFAVDTWPFDVEYVPSQFKWGGIKNYDFVRKLPSTTPGLARWWYKIDDDSINDVAGTVTKLDDDYDWQQPLYICGDYGPGLEPLFFNGIAKSAHAERILHTNQRDKPLIHHERESSFLSQLCLQKIVDDEECHKLLDYICQPQNDVMHCWGDQALAIAARFVRVHQIDCHFTTQWPLVANFSLFGGRFTHIHFIDHLHKDWPMFLELMAKHNVQVG